MASARTHPSSNATPRNQLCACHAHECVWGAFNVTDAGSGKEHTAGQRKQVRQNTIIILSCLAHRTTVDAHKSPRLSAGTHGPHTIPQPRVVYASAARKSSSGACRRVPWKQASLPTLLSRAFVGGAEERGAGMPAAVEFPSLVAVSVVVVLSSCVTAAAGGRVPLGVPSAAEFSPGPLAAAWPPGDGDVGSASPPAGMLRVASDAAAVPGPGEPLPVAVGFSPAGDCDCCADCSPVVVPRVADTSGFVEVAKLFVSLGGVAGPGPAGGGVAPVPFSAGEFTFSVFSTSPGFPTLPFGSWPSLPGV
ncbi:hypothetical protein, conserved [Trypanosoma cruzi]|uniref:Uncharacterized protein n=1 Tax=Trypanosoma cruzi (strain CL Brener) TaxID=353153 RepID=Q4CLB4_TRYCC|nr:hypothetical protein, conserved [Trypanosoma cruzi]EAN81066.1 hypothetical protein, conserved [Trypanosoma cruzi]|eukprot:XP_802512.1 hypothetical protein [Trypanosoma cruzi strain CL Brener]